MPTPTYPLLSGSEQSVYPSGKSCPVCGGAFIRGVAYLSAGALLLSEDGQDGIHTDRNRAFLSLGFHGRESDVRDSADVRVVDDLAGGQFDLNWCSVGCMRQWLLGVLDLVEREVTPKAHE